MSGKLSTNDARWVKEARDAFIKKFGDCKPAPEMTIEEEMEHAKHTPCLHCGIPSEECRCSAGREP